MTPEDILVTKWARDFNVRLTATQHRGLQQAIRRAAQGTDATSDFDSWMENPYTKVLQQSIKDDYVSKGTANPVASAEPTEAMLNAARDWSIAKYGQAIGSDAAIGCWKAMSAASMGGDTK